MRAHNPHLKVHFEVESHKPTDILLPVDLLEHSAIPCHSIILDNPNTQVKEVTMKSNKRQSRGLAVKDTHAV